MSALIETKIIQNLYQDSVKLMLIARKMKSLEGVKEASVSMATPGNLEILEAAGIMTDKAKTASPDDIVLVVKAVDQAACAAALELADSEFAGGNTAVDLEDGYEAPKSIEGAKRMLPGANVVLISVPGKYAYSLADQALELGVNPMIFSDNVTVDEERKLKQKAREKGLIVMGPDCGTAVLDGNCIGFGNKVRRGNIGIVGASGTGIQELCCLIHQGGGGVSHAIGTGGRDLSADIGGISMLTGIDILAADAATEAVMLLSKPANPQVAAKVLQKAAGIGKPVVVCFLGSAPAPDSGSLAFADTMEAAVQKAMGLCGIPFEIEDGPPPAAGRSGKIRALYTGGTLAYEALYLMKPQLGSLGSNVHLDGVAELPDPLRPTGHAVVDLGDDALTVGRAHPMIDPGLRDSMIVSQAADPDVAVLLLDFVLGYGCNEDPVGAALSSIDKAMALQPLHKKPWIYAHVCGTDLDPQDLAGQEARLRTAGAVAFRSNAAMVRAALKTIR